MPKEEYDIHNYYNNWIKPYIKYIWNLKTNKVSNDSLSIISNKRLKNLMLICREDLNSVIKYYYSDIITNRKKLPTSLKTIENFIGRKLIKIILTMSYVVEIYSAQKTYDKKNLNRFNKISVNYIKEIKKLVKSIPTNHSNYKLAESAIMIGLLNRLRHSILVV